MPSSPNAVLLSIADHLPESAATKVMIREGKSNARIFTQADLDLWCLANLEAIYEGSKTGQECLRENGYGHWLDEADMEDRIRMLGWLKMIADMTEELDEEEDEG